MHLCRRPVVVAGHRWTASVHCTGLRNTRRRPQLPVIPLPPGRPDRQRLATGAYTGHLRCGPGGPGMRRRRGICPGRSIALHHRRTGETGRWKLNGLIGWRTGAPHARFSTSAFRRRARLSDPEESRSRAPYDPYAAPVPTTFCRARGLSGRLRADYFESWNGMGARLANVPGRARPRPGPAAPLSRRARWTTPSSGSAAPASAPPRLPGAP